MNIELDCKADLRAWLRRMLQDLDTAEVCIAELRAAVTRGDGTAIAGAAASLCHAWHHAELCISRLRESGAGGGSDRFAREALGASYTAGHRALTSAMTWATMASGVVETEPFATRSAAGTC
jgi:hypothetical protein